MNISMRTCIYMDGYIYKSIYMYIHKCICTYMYIYV